MAIKSQPDPFLTAMREAAKTERGAVEFIEQGRWQGEAACPRCGSVSVYTMTDSKTGERNADFRWRCRDCKKMFTVRTGTVMEESRLPLRIWMHAFWSVSASKKGISALQIKRECEISYKTALFLMHRIRKAMAVVGPNTPKLAGTIEADETYVGGKPRFVPGRDGQKWYSKRNVYSTKAPVFGVVERGGEIRLRAIDTDKIAPAIESLVDVAKSRLNTDEALLYKKVGRKFAGGHESVCHSRHEYVRGDVTTNTIEGAFSLLKRGVYGTFHNISKKHLHRYCAEFEFRYNTRKIEDGARLAEVIRATDGKRLDYRTMVDGEKEVA